MGNLEAALQDEARFARMRFPCLLKSLDFNKKMEQNSELSIESKKKKDRREGERERKQFPQIECLSNKGYQILCEQNNNCALTVVTAQGPSGIKNCSQT